MAKENIVVPDKYNANDRELYWKKYWEDNNTYAFDRDAKSEDVYSIDTPPPTVSGRMHIGHSYSYTHFDFIARYHRMKGKSVFFPFGTDDNGVATERLVEKLKKVRGNKMERNEFIELCRKTIEELRPEFVDDWKRIGMSCDFNLFYSTIDEHSIRTSQKHFLDLVNKGLVYRKEAPVMWDPMLQTALSQTELVDQEQESYMNEIIFRLDDGNDVVIATTRPEMLSACVAVFVNPNDKRYASLLGKELTVPHYNHKVKVYADERVLMDKGTGAVMCCTFGDQTDIEWYKAYSLDLKEAITKDGKMTSISNELEGLSVKEARKKIIEILKEENLLVGQEKIKHTVNVGERSGAEIEILNSKQWFVKTLDYRDQLLELGKELVWHPSHMRNRYDNWALGMQWDWCISRQRFFGVPFPVWYDSNDNPVFADESELPVDPIHAKPKGNDNVVPETDVMDTWATSSLTPFIALGLMGDKKANELYPMDLRPQAHDIITFWLFNTVIRGLHHYNMLPWKNVMISGWVLDPHGKKMSKSKGNIIDPLGIIEKYSADSLRYAASIVKPGDDSPYQEKDIQLGYKTANKLFNVVKFALPHINNISNPSYEYNNFVDGWMLLKLKETIGLYNKSFMEYDYATARRAVDHFFWNILADNYIEFVKHRLYSDNNTTNVPLYSAVHSIIRLYAPIMPYVTEEAYHYSSFGSEDSVHKEIIPDISTKIDDNVTVVNKGNLLVDIIGLIRKEKSIARKSMKHEVKELLLNVPNKDKDLVDDELINEIKNIMFVTKIVVNHEDSASVTVKCIF
ncbi:MAG: valine--tRNA ligase [Candidatus Woesearchaeota archaeon]